MLSFKIKIKKKEPERDRGVNYK